MTSANPKEENSNASSKEEKPNALPTYGNIFICSKYYFN